MIVAHQLLLRAYWEQKMKRRKDSRSPRALCAQTHPDDGIEPRELARRFARSERGRKTNRKDLQLAKQVFHAIDSALRGELSDPLLQELQVVSVSPAPDATHMIVVVAPILGESQATAIEILQSLEKARGFLRCQVAGAITRKRSPELSFRLVDPLEDHE